MIIKINNLVVSGLHGLTEKEKVHSQKFRVDVEVEILNEQPISDDISKTLDYRKIKNNITETIEGKPCMLLETLCEKIADKIYLHEKISFVTVEVSKIEIWDNGFPSVMVTRQKPK